MSRITAPACLLLSTTIACKGREPSTLEQAWLDVSVARAQEKLEIMSILAQQDSISDQKLGGVPIHGVIAGISTILAEVHENDGFYMKDTYDEKAGRYRDGLHTNPEPEDMNISLKTPEIIGGCYPSEGGYWHLGFDTNCVVDAGGFYPSTLIHECGHGFKDQEGVARHEGNLRHSKSPKNTLATNKILTLSFETADAAYYTGFGADEIDAAFGNEFINSQLNPSFLRTSEDLADTTNRIFDPSHGYFTDVDYWTDILTEDSFVQTLRPYYPNKTDRAIREALQTATPAIIAHYYNVMIKTIRGYAIDNDLEVPRDLPEEISGPEALFPELY